MVKTYLFAEAGPDKTVIYSDENGNKAIRMGGSRSWRNNNPGNIRASDFANRNGAIGEAAGYAIFPDYRTGKNALKRLLKCDTYRNLSVADALHRYAPPFENATHQYITFVGNETGISSGQIIQELSIAQFNTFVNAIQKYEGFRVGRLQHAQTNKT